MTEENKSIPLSAIQDMYDFCEHSKMKAGIAAALLIVFVLVGSWNLGQDWRQYGRTYEKFEGVMVDGTMSLGTRTVDNLQLVLFLWVFLAIPAAYLVDHISFVQWVLLNWEPLPPNELEPSD
jgi:hypothetical protein